MKHAPFIVGNFNIKSVKEDDPEFYIVIGYASIYGNIDSYRDIVESGAFSADLIEKGNERPILWQHNSSMPLGVGSFEDSAEGLKVCIKMPKASKLVSEEVMPMVKCGAVKGLSIGYFTVEEVYDREARVNKLIKLRLRETSIVTFPANELAQITAAKEFLGLSETKSSSFTMYPIAEEKAEWDREKAIANIKENTGSAEKPSKQYCKGFLLCDPEEKEEFNGYKLPYAKWDGKGFQIIPKAVYEAAGTVGLSSSSLNISTEDLQAIKRNINQVYLKMGQEEPFKGGTFFIDKATLKNMVNSDLESVFNNDDVILSSGAKRVIIDSLGSGSSRGSVEQSDNNLLDFLKDANQEMSKIN